MEVISIVAAESYPSRLTHTHDSLSRVSRPTKHIIGHIWDGFLRVKWPNQ